MKILFLTYDLPYPLISGGKVRAYHLIKNLARNNQITLFSYYRDEEQKKYLQELKKYCPKIYLFKRRKPWSWQNLLRAFLTPLPFTSATYHSPQLKAALTKELRENQYDLVHFESFYPALYLPLAKQFKVKTIMGNENLEYQVYNRYADSRKLFLLRWLLKLEVFRMRLFEEKLWREADLNLALSKEDAAVIERLTKKRCSVIPNGVDLKTFRKSKDYQAGKRLIFVGTLIYQANNDAMQFFLNEVYPQIKKRIKKLKFILVSWHKPRWLEKHLSDSSLKLIEDKETPASEFLGQGDILVAAIRLASGTNIKVLEAMACGLPVVTTSLGIEGIRAKDGKELIVRDNPQEFAHEVVKLLGDKSRRQKLGQAGRLLVEKYYDWSAITKKLEKTYQELVYGQKKT